MIVEYRNKQYNVVNHSIYPAFYQILGNKFNAGMKLILKKDCTIIKK